MAHNETRANAVNSTFGLEIQDYLGTFVKNSKLKNDLQRPDNTVVMRKETPTLTTTDSPECLRSKYIDIQPGSSQSVMLKLTGASVSGGGRFRLSGNTYGGLCTNNQKVLEAYKNAYENKEDQDLKEEHMNLLHVNKEGINQLKESINQLPKKPDFDRVRKNADKAFDRLEEK